MSFSIYTTTTFDKQLKRLSKKYVSLAKDFASFLTELEENPTLDTNLGNNCYKVRLAIKSKAKGKSGGARIITLVLSKQEIIYLVAVYDKSEKESLSNKELKELIKGLAEDEVDEKAK
jgi:mRNA-degrading endonuclease RelE of RelBE toxin-antitoxin system